MNAAPDSPVACTLQAPRVAALLSRSFADVEANDAQRQQVFASMAPGERARMFEPGSDYRQLYGRARELYLAVSPETARLLYRLARSIGARSIVEFGTSFGVSTIWRACGRPLPVISRSRSALTSSSP